MEEKNTKFTYSYSAENQAEVEKIRQKYLPREESKLEQLRKLDQGVTKKGTVAALILGILSALVFGIGMCCTTIWGNQLFLPGVVIGVVGLVGMALTYPLYLKITKAQRKKLAPRILELTNELMK